MLIAIIGITAVTSTGRNHAQRSSDGPKPSRKNVGFQGKLGPNGQSPLKQILLDFLHAEDTVMKQGRQQCC